MKGQFMLISAIIIGIIVISVSSAVTTTNSQTYNIDQTPYLASNIKDEAGKVEDDDKEVESFIRNLESLNEYNTDVAYWNSKQCFNLTMIRIGRSLRMSCVG